MNVLGAIGLRSAASKKKMRQDKITGANEIQELRAQLAAVMAASDCSPTTNPIWTGKYWNERHDFLNERP
jgi:hypothetical protein